MTKFCRFKVILPSLMAFVLIKKAIGMPVRNFHIDSKSSKNPSNESESTKKESSGNIRPNGSLQPTSNKIYASVPHDESTPSNEKTNGSHSQNFSVVSSGNKTHEERHNVEISTSSSRKTSTAQNKRILAESFTKAIDQNVRKILAEKLTLFFSAEKNIHFENISEENKLYAIISGIDTASTFSRLAITESMKTKLLNSEEAHLPRYELVEATDSYRSSVDSSANTDESEITFNNEELARGKKTIEEMKNERTTISTEETLALNRIRDTTFLEVIDQAVKQTLFQELSTFFENNKNTKFQNPTNKRFTTETETNVSALFSTGAPLAEFQIDKSVLEIIDQVVQETLSQKLRTSSAAKNADFSLVPENKVNVSELSRTNVGAPYFKAEVALPTLSEFFFSDFSKALPTIKNTRQQGSVLHEYNGSLNEDFDTKNVITPRKLGKDFSLDDGDEPTEILQPDSNAANVGNILKFIHEAIDRAVRRILVQRLPAFTLNKDKSSSPFSKNKTSASKFAFQEEVIHSTLTKNIPSGASYTNDVMGKVVSSPEESCSLVESLTESESSSEEADKTPKVLEVNAEKINVPTSDEVLVSKFPPNEIVVAAIDQVLQNLLIRKLNASLSANKNESFRDSPCREHAIETSKLSSFKKGAEIFQESSTIKTTCQHDQVSTSVIDVIDDERIQNVASNTVRENNDTRRIQSGKPSIPEREKTATSISVIIDEKLSAGLEQDASILKTIDQRTLTNEKRATGNKVSGVQDLLKNTNISIPSNEKDDLSEPGQLKTPVNQVEVETTLSTIPHTSSITYIPDELSSSSTTTTQVTTANGNEEIIVRSFEKEKNLELYQMESSTLQTASTTESLFSQPSHLTFEEIRQQETSTSIEQYYDSDMTANEKQFNSSQIAETLYNSTLRTKSPDKNVDVSSLFEEAGNGFSERSIFQTNDGTSNSGVLASDKSSFIGFPDSEANREHDKRESRRASEEEVGLKEESVIPRVTLDARTSMSEKDNDSSSSPKKRCSEEPSVNQQASTEESNSNDVRLLHNELDTSIRKTLDQHELGRSEIINENADGEVDNIAAIQIIPLLQDFKVESSGRGAPVPVHSLLGANLRATMPVETHPTKPISEPIRENEASISTGKKERKEFESVGDEEEISQQVEHKYHSPAEMEFLNPDEANKHEIESENTREPSTSEPETSHIQTLVKEYTENSAEISSMDRKKPYEPGLTELPPNYVVVESYPSSKVQSTNLMLDKQHEEMRNVATGEPTSITENVEEKRTKQENDNDGHETNVEGSIFIETEVPAADKSRSQTAHRHAPSITSANNEKKENASITNTRISYAQALMSSSNGIANNKQSRNIDEKNRAQTATVSTCSTLDESLSEAIDQTVKFILTQILPTVPTTRKIENVAEFSVMSKETFQESKMESILFSIGSSRQPIRRTVDSNKKGNKQDEEYTPGELEKNDSPLMMLEGKEMKNARISDWSETLEDDDKSMLVKAILPGIDLLAELARMSIDPKEFGVSTTIFFPRAVLFQCDTSEDAQNLRKIVIKSGKLDAIKRKKSRRDLAYIRNVPRDTTIAELSYAIFMKFKESPKNVRFAPHHDGKVAFFEVSETLLKKIEATPNVRIRWHPHDIETSSAVALVRCRRCHLLGHASKYCNLPPRSLPTSSEQCIDCDYYNECSRKAGFFQNDPRGTNHPTNHDCCPTKATHALVKFGGEIN